MKKTREDLLEEIADLENEKMDVQCDIADSRDRLEEIINKIEILQRRLRTVEEENA